jgi:hypothetical protein
VVIAERKEAIAIIVSFDFYAIAYQLFAFVHPERNCGRFLKTHQQRKSSLSD